MANVVVTYHIHTATVGSDKLYVGEGTASRGQAVQPLRALSATGRLHCTDSAVWSAQVESILPEKMRHEKDFSALPNHNVVACHQLVGAALQAPDEMLVPQLRCASNTSSSAILFL